MRDFLKNRYSSEWQSFLRILVGDRSICSSAHPYLARWLEEWLIHPTSSEKPTRDSTESFFETLGRRKGLEDWQFRQAVSAIKIWSLQVEVFPWASSFPWDGLVDQSRALEKTHRTVMREVVDVVSSGREVPGKSRADFIPVPQEEEMIASLVEKARFEIRLRDLAVTTEKTYLHWNVRFGRFRLRRLRERLDDLQPSSISRYLEYLAVERKVSPGTQKQALNALVFAAKKVYHLEELELDYKPARQRYRRLPTVLTREETQKVFGLLSDPWKLIVQVMYGSGLRQSEALRLRVKDLDFGQGTIQIHDGKGENTG